MRHRAVIAGCCVALGLMPGCAGARLRRDRAAESPAEASIRRELRQAATASMDRGDYVQARADLAIEPRYVGALIGLGQVAARLGRPEEALRRFETAIEFDPHQAEAHFARGQVLETLGRADDALAAYFHSLELNPAGASAMTRVAALQLDRGKPDQALVRLEQASELAPDDAEIRYRRGLAYLALKRPEKATPDLRFAADRLAGRGDVFLALAQALDADRKPAEARQAVDKALALQPDSRIARDLAERLRR